METACVYILFSGKLQRFYTGHTTDLKQRFAQHNDPVNNGHWSRNGIPWSLFLVITCTTGRQARQIEFYIKKQRSTKYIRGLKDNPEWIDNLLKRFEP
jgi:putative endonuclease